MYQIYWNMHVHLNILLDYFLNYGRIQPDRFLVKSFYVEKVYGNCCSPLFPKGYDVRYMPNRGILWWKPFLKSYFPPSANSYVLIQTKRFSNIENIKYCCKALNILQYGKNYLFNLLIFIKEYRKIHLNKKNTPKDVLVNTQLTFTFVLQDISFEYRFRWGF